MLNLKIKSYEKILFLSLLFFSTTFLVNAQNPSLIELSTYKLKIKYGAPVKSSTANSTNILVRGDQTGLRGGTYNTNDSVVTFLPTRPFKAGEKISITSKSSLQDINNNTMPAWVWEKYAPITRYYTSNI